MLIDSSVMEIDLQTTLQDTFEEAKTYMIKHQISDHVTACIQFINDYHNLVTQKDGSETVFSNACLSAQSLNLDMEKHWTDLSYEWLEGLQLGALGCRPTLHAENTSRGGEFLTFTWFILQHFCLTMNASNEYEESSTNYDLNVL
ncbi:hypothetical protein FEM48_Zijuj11G0136600 [Ziziphus jujuba var. spinosa]|uniref:Uncharacterized protein n=1 Tax=Ziziphus jujuba var. spinosa TaxID=714518 RepID=A0A978UJ92_ZIZJJ|nr:hypothetical protein FEM48_Zijuj11G0136600 [Ziziphus jujuba var. spinosa]